MSSTKQRNLILFVTRRDGYRRDDGYYATPRETSTADQHSSGVAGVPQLVQQKIRYYAPVGQVLVDISGDTVLDRHVDQNSTDMSVDMLLKLSGITNR